MLWVGTHMGTHKKNRAFKTPHVMLIHLGRVGKIHLNPLFFQVLKKNPDLLQIVFAME
jgi:hypothetical protein